jgi:type 1 fimbriae regulatory protein FimB/type 1 fimbriae regulatory protein FimE
LRVVSGQAIERKPPGRRRNSEVRAREYLTEAEVERLCRVARKRGRYGHRDAAMILLC